MLDVDKLTKQYEHDNSILDRREDAIFYSIGFIAVIVSRVVRSGLLFIAGVAFLFAVFGFDNIWRKNQRHVTEAYWFFLLGLNIRYVTKLWCFRNGIKDKINLLGSDFKF